MYWTNIVVVMLLYNVNYITVTVTVLLVSQSCLTLCDPMDCSPIGPSVHGILQARILEWVAIPFFSQWLIKNKIQECLNSTISWHVISVYFLLFPWLSVPGCYLEYLYLTDGSLVMDCQATVSFLLCFCVVKEQWMDFTILHLLTVEKMQNKEDIFTYYKI